MLRLGIRLRPIKPQNITELKIIAAFHLMCLRLRCIKKTDFCDGHGHLFYASQINKGTEQISNTTGILPWDGKKVIHQYQEKNRLMT